MSVKRLAVLFSPLVIAAGLFAFHPATGQGNPTCPTRPTSDASNACASTQFVQNVSNGVIALLSGQGGSGANLLPLNNTWTGINTFSPTSISTSALVITPYANTNEQGINIIQSSPVLTRSQSTGFGYNTIALTDIVPVSASGSTFGWPNGHSVGLLVTDVTGGSNLTGNAHKAIQGLIRETVANSNAGDTIAIGGQAYSNVTGPAGAAVGGILSGGAFQSVCDTGCNHNWLEGVEIDIGATNFGGSSGTIAANRVGLAVWGIGTSQAPGVDSAIGVTGYNATGGSGGAFSNLVTLTNMGGSNPLLTSGNMFVADTAYTVANVFNLSNMTVTGSILSFPNVEMTGSGLLSLGSSTAPGTPSILNATCASCGQTQLFAAQNTAVTTALNGVNTRTAGGTNIYTLYASEPLNTSSAFNQSLGNWVSFLASGISNNGMELGTVVNTPIVLGTNNISRMVIQGGGNIGFGTETNPQFPFVFSQNTTTGATISGLPGPFGGPWTIGATGNAQGWNTIAVAAAAVNNFFRVDGTISSPSNLGSGEQVGSITFGGWGAGGQQATRARIQAQTTEAWTTTFGTSLELDATPAGGTRGAAMLIQGGVNIGVTTTDPGSGVLNLSSQAFSNLKTCTSSLRGSIAAVSNSNTATWGATVAGGGTNEIIAHCNGSNWTVMGD